MSNVIHNDIGGAPGQIIGWTKIRQETARMVVFINPRTNAKVGGYFVTLEGPDESVWYQSGGKWSRAPQWMRTAYLERLKRDLSQPSISTIEHQPIPASVDSFLDGEVEAL